MNPGERAAILAEAGDEGGEDLAVGDVVCTRTFGLRYRVVRIRRDRVVCEPLSQPHWHAHFMFPAAYLRRIPRTEPTAKAEDRG